MEDLTATSQFGGQFSVPPQAEMAKTWIPSRLRHHLVARVGEAAEDQPQPLLS